MFFFLPSLSSVIAEAFDSFRISSAENFELDVFQATIATQHDVLASEITKLRQKALLYFKRFNNWFQRSEQIRIRFIFVVPKKVFKGYKPQNFKKDHKRMSHGPKNLRQFVIGVHDQATQDRMADPDFNNDEVMNIL